MLTYFLHPTRRSYRLFNLIPGGVSVPLFSKARIIFNILIEEFLVIFIIILILLGLRYGFNLLNTHFPLDKNQYADKVLIGILLFVILWRLYYSYIIIKSLSNKEHSNYRSLLTKGIHLLDENKPSDAMPLFAEARKVAKEFHMEEGFCSFLQAFALIKIADFTKDTEMQKKLYSIAIENALFSTSGNMHIMFRKAGDFGSYAGMDFFAYHLLKSYSDYHLDRKEEAKKEFDIAWTQYQPLKSYFPKAKEWFNYLKNRLN